MMEPDSGSLACVTNLRLPQLLNAVYSGSSPSLSVSFLVGPSNVLRFFFYQEVVHCQADNLEWRWRHNSI